MIDPAFELELLNGDGVITGAVFLAYVVAYVRWQMHTLGLGFWDWALLRLPHHINFAVSVMVYDTGVWMRSVAIWVWRSFMGAGPMPMWLFGVLMLGALLIVAGNLCKIRALSDPVRTSYGTIRPWVATTYAVLFFMGASIYFR